MPPEIEFQQKIAKAAMRLAEVQDWPEVTLAAIAAEADVSLSAMRRNGVASSATALKIYIRMIDEEVLERARSEVDMGDPARDRLFDVLMMRFDAMTGDKAAIKRIIETGPNIPELTQPLLNAQRWMLAASGIDIDGGIGLVRTFGLTSIYREVFGVWLEDDAGNTQTMALLDRRLRRAERNMRNLDRVKSSLSGLCNLGKRVGRRRRSGDDGSDDAMGMSGQAADGPDPFDDAQQDGGLGSADTSPIGEGGQQAGVEGSGQPPVPPAPAN